jgi:hypothetical protein
MLYGLFKLYITLTLVLKFIKNVIVMKALHNPLTFLTLSVEPEGTLNSTASIMDYIEAASYKMPLKF